MTPVVGTEGDFVCGLKLENNGSKMEHGRYLRNAQTDVSGRHLEFYFLTVSRSSMKTFASNLVGR